MASLTRWTWVWVNSGRWWWTGRPGVLQFMGSQRVEHDWATELNWTVYTCNLFLISYLTISVLYRMHSCMKCSLSILLKRSLVVPILLFSISLHCSLKEAFLFLLALLWNSEFTWVYLSLSPLPFTSLLSPAICTVSSDNHLAFLHFFGMVLVTASCIMLQTSVHSSSGTLSTRSNPSNLFIISIV